MKNTVGYRKWLLFPFFLLLCMGMGLGFWQQPAASELLKITDDMVQRVAHLRGLEPKAAIPKQVETRDEIAKFLRDTVREEYDPADLQSEGQLLKKLGLVPTNMDYLDFTLKLLTEQVSGYYDPGKKTFFIAGWLPVDQQKPVMVHELTHALQDQHFDLSAIMKKDRKAQDDDRVLAHQAVMEGDGMAVMLNYLLEPAGRNFSQIPDLVFVMRSQFWGMESQFQVFSAAPMYMKEILLFPYGYGGAFLQKVWAKDPSWAAINKIYSDLPSSTEQIIHPEKYLGPRDDPKPVVLEDPSAALGSGWKRTYKNTLGEFSTFLMLKQFIPEEQARRAATGWGGDQFWLVSDGSRSTVFGVTTWDAPEDAERFYAALGAWFQARFPKAKRVNETAGGFGLLDGGEYHAVQRNGSDVRCIVGLPEAESEKLATYWTLK
jgi:hypothetical protein